MIDCVPAFSDKDRLDWLRLIRSENVGPRTFFRLLEQFGTASAALDHIPDLARKGGRAKSITLCSKATAEKELAAWQKLGCRLIAAIEGDYPHALAQLEDAPPLLGVRGHAHLLSKPCIAIVGARNASLAGKKFAQQLAHDLGEMGFIIVSGLARGIDTHAHMGAMPSGTVAAMAGGLDVVYPPENSKLYEDLCAMGAAVSEMPPGTQPQASHFPRRNRIVSGLSLGVVVVEANLRSGSLITARLAAEQGRDVFAVPGSPLDPRCQGPNDLIRHGAVLTENAEDVARILSAQLASPLRDDRKRRGFDQMQTRLLDETELEKARPLILEALGPTPIRIDELMRLYQVSPAIISMILLEMELAGRLERHAGGQVSRLF